MEDILEKIVREKRRELAKMPPVFSGDLRPSDRDLCHFIATQRQEIAVIAEIKRATPFRGRLITEEIDVAALAKIYEEAGAAAISVLTDKTFFQGSLQDLECVSAATALPVLRKDFILDARQIYEARHHGADAVLVIVRCLTDEELRTYLDTCHSLHMRALVEVHDERELQRALKLNAHVIGINNRNLRDGTTNPETTLRLLEKVPQETIVVAESGIQKPEDLKPLLGKVDAVLVGGALMTAPNPRELLESLVKAGQG